MTLWPSRMTTTPPMALNRVWIPSPFYSSRGGQRVRLIVLHTAEGSTTIESLGGWFQNPSAQVSSHVGIDDKPNTVGEYVSRSGSAWTAAAANPYSVQAELCAFAKWTPSDWAAHPVMLQNCAAWIAEEAAAFGIPLVKLTAAQAQGGGSGVCQHVDLGAAGGGHWDCGGSFPMDQVIAMAAGGGSAGPAPKPQVGNMLITQDNGDGYWMLGGDGGVFAKGGAPFCGSIPGVGAKPTTPIIGGASTPSGQGYWLVNSSGEVFAFGDAQYLGPDPSWRADWGIGTPDNPVIGIAACKISGGPSYALGAARAGKDPADYGMEPDGRYAKAK